MVYDWIIENKESIKIIYALIIVFICVVIVLRTNRLFRLSLHQGIRYFRNAFFFYGLAFVARYFLGAIFPSYLFEYFLIKILFEFFLMIAGFFLLYSLLWKKLEKEDSFSSLFNSRIVIFYIMASVLVFLDYLWQTYYFMFFSQIVLFAFASVVSYINYKKGQKEHKFLKFYFLAMVLSLIAWILNAISAMWLDWHKGVLINVYMLNIIIFLLFLYGVIMVTKK